MDDDIPRSLFVVVSWKSTAACCLSILQLETHKHNHDEDPEDLTVKPRIPFIRRLTFSSLGAELNQKEYVAHFNRPQGSSAPNWVFSRSTEELYMLPYWNIADHDNDVPLHGCVFNFRTKSCRPMPPNALKVGHVATLGGCIYVIAQPDRCFDPPFKRSDLPFMRYDPANAFWYQLEPFPGHAAHKADSIVATAVLNDTILFNMRGCELWAYDVNRDKWCHVKVDANNLLCHSIEGEAVVLGNTIYALTTRYINVILALSLQREDLEFVCNVRFQIPVSDIDPLSFEGAEKRTRHLVHLGKDNFCLVQSCNLDGSSSYRYQPIQLTNILLTEESSQNSEYSMTVIDNCVHQLQLPDFEQFCVEFCFSLPEYKTTVLKEGKNFCFNLDPFPEGFDPKRKFKTDSDSEPEEEIGTLPEDWPLISVHAFSELLAKLNGPSKASLGNGAASEAIFTDAEEGHSFYLTNLLSNATFGQFKKELEKLWPSERLEIICIIDDDSVSAIITKGCRAEMEEESRLGLTVDMMSDIMITEGCRAETEEERRTGLTVGRKDDTDGVIAQIEDHDGGILVPKVNGGMLAEAENHAAVRDAVVVDKFVSTSMEEYKEEEGSKDELEEVEDLVKVAVGAQLDKKPSENSEQDASSKASIFVNESKGILLLPAMTAPPTPGKKNPNAVAGKEGRDKSRMRQIINPDKENLVQKSDEELVETAPPTPGKKNPNAVAVAVAGKENRDKSRMRQIINANSKKDKEKLVKKSDEKLAETASRRTVLGMLPLNQH